jgi:hypothetical protein
MDYKSFFQSRGFEKQAESWILLSHKVTFTPTYGVISPNQLSDYDVYVDGLDDADASRIWYDALFEDNPISFFLNEIQKLEASSKEEKDDDVNNEEEEAPGFSKNAKETKRLDKLPNINTNRNRELLIYTWGRRNGHKPFDSQFNFHAAILHGNTRHGLDLRKLRGTDEEIQDSVMSSENFHTFMTMVLEKIETSDFNIISISCVAGHHRSVACAEILKKFYYPNALVKHLCLHK